jgi:uncharacterized protein
MQILPHDLGHEFPEYMTTIIDLKARDEGFARLFEDYERVNAEIVDIEENDKPFEDFAFEEMKKRRLRLKDEIYLILRAGPQAGTPVHLTSREREGAGPHAHSVSASA